MTIILRYFAWVRERIGQETETLPFDTPMPLSRLLDELATTGPAHAEALADRQRLRVAINEDIVGWDAIASPGDEVAIFPPVTGG